MSAQSWTSSPQAVPAAECGDDGVIIGRSVDDPEQFATIFRRHVPEIQRYVVRRLGGIQAAEDVVAETFVTAFRQRAGYQCDRADARPWLFGIASNLIGRHRRTEIRLYRALARTGADAVSEPFTDRVDSAVTADSSRARLGAALATLPAGQRDALLLITWGGLSYEQAAQALAVPVGTVRSRVSRARQALRSVLGDLDPVASGEPLAALRRNPRHARTKESDHG